jgi:hypothetical protein
MAGEVGFALRPGGGRFGRVEPGATGSRSNATAVSFGQHPALPARRCSSSPMSPTTYHPITGMVWRLDALLG